LTEVFLSWQKNRNPRIAQKVDTIARALPAREREKYRIGGAIGEDRAGAKKNAGCMSAYQFLAEKKAIWL